MKKKMKFILTAVIFVLVLGACQTVQPVTVKDTQATQPQAENTPSGEADAYPAYPAESVPSQDPQVSYPVQTPVKIYEPGELPTAPETAPEPQDGMASLSGTLFSFTDRSSVLGTPIYLTSAIGDNLVPPVLVGPDTEKGDIISRTDENGNFTFDNVPPGNYYLVAWSPYTWTVGVVEPSEEAEGRLIQLEAGQKEVLGVMYISWP